MKRNEPTHAVFALRYCGDINVSFTDDGFVAIAGHGHSIQFNLRDARLLARRINQALDYRRKWMRKGGGA